jgi:hypothetical protein
MTEVTLVIDGNDVPVTDFQFDTPRHAHKLISSPGATGPQVAIGTCGFGLSFYGPSSVIDRYLDGQPHDVAISNSQADLPVTGIKLRKYHTQDGTSYGYGVMDENYQVPAWKEKVTNG